MRVWVDPNKLNAYGLTMNELAQAIEQQNVQIAPGRIGDEPALPGQRLTVPLTVQGQLTTPEEFAAIVLRASADGAKLVLGDVARVELGAQSYGFSNRENGVAATSAAIQLSPGANAVQTASAIRERLAELAPSLPVGMAYALIPAKPALHIDSCHCRAYRVAWHLCCDAACRIFDQFTHYVRHGAGHWYYRR